jgi:hypothetical protein
MTGLVGSCRLYRLTDVPAVCSDKAPGAVKDTYAARLLWVNSDKTINIHLINFLIFAFQSS